jgi:2'-5' RNA ligase
MRCFLAIELSDEAKNELVKIQEELKPFVLAKFVEKENLHLSLKFLGELDKEQINKVKDSLRKIKFGKLQGSLGKIGFFPNNKSINVIWVSLEPREKIRELNVMINDSLNNKDENFVSHLTLTRVKKVKDKLGFLKKVENIKIKPISFSVNSFVLKKSTLTEKGPIYEDIERFELS